MKENDVVGLSIALVDNQRVAWTAGFGYADRANNDPASPVTLYRVGSISKLFTSTAAMQLAEQKKIDIDKPLKTYLPSFSIKSRFPDAAPITPRTIMHHHSGLPSDVIKGMFNPDPGPPTEVIGLLEDQYVAYPPNYVHSYSNSGMTLLGCMIQQVAGQPFAKHMDEAVLRPIGMRHASFVIRPDMQRLVSKGYKNGKETPQVLLRDQPAGSLYASVMDLSRLMHMVFADGRAGDRQIIKPETLAEMLRPQNADIPLDFDLRIGLGWFLTSARLGYAGRSHPTAEPPSCFTVI